MLYNQPVSLVIYWSVNNFLSLLKNLIEKRKLINIKTLYKNEKFNLGLILFYLFFQFIAFISNNNSKTEFSILLSILSNLYFYFLIFKKHKDITKINN